MFKITEKDLKWLGVDLDATIAESHLPEFILEKPFPGAKEALDKLVLDGWKIVIYTARPWSEYSVIEEWLKEYDIPVSRIICGKLFCKYFIDDRNISFSGNWQEVLEVIDKKGKE